MNNALNQLQPYPFEKLRELLGSARPPAEKAPIALSIGEPKHRSPEFVARALADNLEQLAVYPTTRKLQRLASADRNLRKQRTLRANRKYTRLAKSSCTLEKPTHLNSWTTANRH